MLAWGVFELAKLAILQHLSHPSGIIVPWMHEESPRIFLYVLSLENLQDSRCQLSHLFLKGFILKCITFSIDLGLIRVPRRRLISTDLSEQDSTP